MPDFGFTVIHSSGVETGLTPQRLFYLDTVKVRVNVSRRQGEVVWQGSYSFDTNKYELVAFISMPAGIAADMSGNCRLVISGNTVRVESNGPWQDMAMGNVPMIALIGMVEK